MLIAIASAIPLVAGCVSAVEDSPALGFGNIASSTNGSATLAADPTKPGDEAPVKTAATPASKPAEPSVVAEDKLSKPENVPDAKKVADDVAPIAGGRTTIAAYSGATVTVGASAEPDLGPSQADKTRFASLFAESESKTPIRNADVGKGRRVLLRHEGAPVEMAALPGVKDRSSLFEIGQKASADYDADILDEANGDVGSYQVASLTGMARLAPNGLMVQRPDVDTSCFEPKLVSLIRAVESRFNTKVVVTSGYRSPSHNKRVNGAQHSLHMACKAADIQVPGADKIAVANYVRALPGRGGVGTYCHTTAIHVDIGDQRDWNWACYRRRT